MGSMMAAFCEGMALADAAGLSQGDLLEVLSLGAMNNPSEGHPRGATWLCVGPAAVGPAPPRAGQLLRARCHTAGAAEAPRCAHWRSSTRARLSARGRAASWVPAVFSLKGPAVQKRAYPPAFPLKHQQKDMRLALALGCVAGCRLPVPPVLPRCTPPPIHSRVRCVLAQPLV